MTEDLIKTMRSNPEVGKRLFWFEKASDELLVELYQTASALLMASEGEGFGLPLIEAARYRLPIVTRNLPVFREVVGDNAFYFDGTDSETLAEALKTWLILYRQGRHPHSEGTRWLTWAESAQQLKQVIFEFRWKACWNPRALSR